jgi:hypothetical protein
MLTPHFILSVGTWRLVQDAVAVLGLAVSGVPESSKMLVTMQKLCLSKSKYLYYKPLVLEVGAEVVVSLIWKDFFLYCGSKSISGDICPTQPIVKASSVPLLRAMEVFTAGGY